MYPIFYKNYTNFMHYELSQLILPNLDKILHRMQVLEFSQLDERFRQRIGETKRLGNNKFCSWNFYTFVIKHNDCYENDEC